MKAAHRTLHIFKELKLKSNLKLIYRLRSMTNVKSNVSLYPFSPNFLLLNKCSSPKYTTMIVQTTTITGGPEVT